MKSAFGSAVSAVLDGLRRSGGRVMMFQASLPTSGLGRLESRESLKDYGTEQEKTMYIAGPGSDFYSNVGRSAASQQIGIDLYVGSTSFADIATCGTCMLPNSLPCKLL